MDLKELLLKENIDYDMLQKSLKHLGLELSQYHKTEVSNEVELIELFHKSLGFTSKTRRAEKEVLRYKIEGTLNPQKSTAKTTNKVISKKSEDISINLQIESNKEPKFYTKKKPVKSSKQPAKSIGLVKFLAKDKSHAFILPLQDFAELKEQSFFEQKGYRANNNEIDEEIQKGQLVYFLKIDNYGRPTAHNIDIYFPAYIINDPALKNSKAVILFEDSNLQEINLNQRIESGFFYICVEYKNGLGKWEILSETSLDYESGIPRNFANSLYAFLLLQNKVSINEILLLKDKINEYLNFDELNVAFSTCLDKIENEEISVQRSRLKNLIILGLPDYLLPIRTGSFNKTCFSIWMEDTRANLPVVTEENDIENWLTFLQGFNSRYLIHVIHKLQSKKEDKRLIQVTFSELLARGIVIETLLDYEAIKQLLLLFKTDFYTIPIKEHHFDCKNIEHFILLFKDGILDDFPETVVLTHINKLITTSQKVAFIESLPHQFVPRFFSLFPELSSHFQGYLTEFLNTAISEIPFVSFDIESDKHKISEFAWTNNSSSKNNQDFETFEQGVRELIQELNSGKIVVGQNIKNFDLPVLQEFGLIDPAISIWDTFEIEMLLHPSRYSYSLKTTHNAISDSNLTLQLFKNQIFRIACSNLNTEKWGLFVPMSVLELISRIKENTFWQHLEASIFEKQSNSFFRPEPTFKNIPVDTFNALHAQLTKSKSCLLIAPTFLWETLSRNFRMGFIADNSLSNKILSSAKVKIAFEEDVFIKQVLLQFIQIKEKKKIIPYYHLLPTAIRNLLSPEDVGVVTDPFIEFTDTIKCDTHCISPDELDKIKYFAKLQPDINIIVLGIELYALTSKVQLGNDFDFATIFDRLKNEPIWLQMSGGKNYIPIKSHQCILLGIKTFPDYLNNLWLEKIGKGKFKIWCNLNFDKFLVDIGNTNIQYIPWTKDNTKKNNAFIVRPDFKKSGYLADQKRVNPESLFRKLYWIIAIPNLS